MTSWQIDGGAMETVTVTDFIFSKITANSDCSHDIKSCLFLGRKAMINIDSVLKSRDIALLIKAHLVMVMIFPIVIYGCKSWTIKKAECWRSLLRVLWIARRSNQSVLNEINPEYSLEGLILKQKLQYFGHLMWRADSSEKNLMLEKLEGRKRRGQQRMRRLGGQWTWAWAHSGDSEGQGSLLCCSPWGCKETDMISDEQQRYSWGAVIFRSLKI